MLNIEDHDELVAYLRQRGHISPNEAVACETLAGGVSCRTVLVRRSSGTDPSNPPVDIVLKQALALLRVAEVWEGDPGRIEIEADAMRVLGELLKPGQVPTLLFEDRSLHLLAMTAVPEPHRSWKAALLAGALDDRHVVEFARMLAAIHVGAYDRRHELAKRFADRSQFDDLRLDPYYRFTAGAVPSVAPWMGTLIENTEATAVTLVHGDYSPKNVLLSSAGCVLLDHEVAHWGDPAFDIGFATAHFLGKANHLSEQRDEFSDAARLFWSEYAAEVAELPWYPSLTRRALHHSMACTLARVCGKSPLEYLTVSQRADQRAAVLALIDQPPATYDQLVTRYTRGLSR